VESNAKSDIGGGQMQKVTLEGVMQKVTLEGVIGQR